MISLALGVVGLALSTGVAGPQPPRNDAQLLIIRERFEANGAEPYFFEVHAGSDVERRAVRSDRVEFELLLRNFDLWLGSEPPLRSIWDEGVEPLVIAQDPTTQRVASDVDRRAAEYLDRILGSLDGGPRSGSWSEQVRLFDAGLLPGLPATVVDVDFTVRPISIMGADYLEVSYETQPFAFSFADREIKTAYFGLAIVDVAKTQVYHSAFLQEGFVTTGAKTTRIWHCTHLKLAWAATGEPVMPEETFPDDLVRASRRFDIIGSPSADAQLEPTADELPPEPVWVAGTWLAGRMSSMVMGAVAEGRSNPLPVLSLGSIYLTDNAIEVGGNYHLLHNDVIAGLRDEEAADYSDYSYQSLRRAFYDEYSPDTPEDERGPVLLPPDRAQGKTTVGDEVYYLTPIGFGIVRPRPGSFRSTPAPTPAPLAAAPGTAYFGPPPSPGVGIGALIPVLGIGGLAALDDGSGAQECSPFTGTYFGSWSPNATCAIFGGQLELNVMKDGSVQGNASGSIGQGEGSRPFAVTFRGRVADAGNFSASGTLDSGQLGRFTWTGNFAKSGTAVMANGEWTATRDQNGDSVAICPGGPWNVGGTAQE